MSDKVKKIAIIGATGSLGRVLREELLQNTEDQMILFARSANKLTIQDEQRETLVAGDVLHQADLDRALVGVDTAFVALSGNLKAMAESIVTASERNHINKLIFISSMGIYNEIPASVGASGNLHNNPILQTYRDGADAIETFSGNYTIIRPGWFDNGSDDYEVTGRHEPFGGHDVSRQAIIHLVRRLIEDKSLYARDSIGINRPE